VLPDHPAVACLTLARVRGRDESPVVRAEVTFHNLTAAEAGAVVVLSEQPAGPDQSLTSTQLGLAVLPNGRLLAVVGRELYPITVPVLVPEMFPRPVHVPPNFPVLVAAGAEVSVRLPTAVGGKPPHSYSLEDEMPGVRIDDRTGELVVTPERIGPELTGHIVKSLRASRTPSPLNVYLSETGPRFEHLAGKKPTGIPVWVPVSLVARDKLLGRTVVETGFIVDVPAEGVRAKIGEKP
jgi:hypothetical protein